MNQTNGKLRIAYLTSCRELVKEHIGASVDGDWPYRVGSLEALVKELESNEDFAAVFELALVICDDTDDEFAEAWKTAELGPRDLLLVEDGKRTLVKELVHRIPSLWRAIPAVAS